MNDTHQLEFETAQAGESQDDKMLAILTAMKGGWVSLPYLVECGCGYATHSRAASLRKKGFNVENRVDRSSKPFKSWYRLIA